MTLAEAPPSNIKVTEMIPDDSKPENVELENCMASTKITKYLNWQQFVKYLVKNIICFMIGYTSILHSLYCTSS